MRGISSTEILGIVLVGIGLLIRMKILETPSFTKIKDTHSVARQPVIEVLRKYRLLAEVQRLEDGDRSAVMRDRLGGPARGLERETAHQT